MIRNILNHLGQIVGTMELPDDTSEEVWQAKLAPFAVAPRNITIETVINDKLFEYEKLAPALLREIKTSNTLAGITDAQSAQMFHDFGDVLLMVREGAFPTALYALSQKQPSGFVTQQILDAWIAKIKEYV